MKLSMKLSIVVPFVIYMPIIVTSFVLSDVTSMQSVNIVFMNVSFAHIFFFMTRIDLYSSLNPFSIITNALHLYETEARNAIYFVCLLVSSITYQSVVFNTHICTYKCDTIYKVLSSFHTLLGISTLIYTVIIFFYIYSFLTQHTKTWLNIIKKEKNFKSSELIMYIFNISDGQEESGSFISKHFLNKWHFITNDELTRNAVIRASQMFHKLVSYADNDCDHRISKEEYDIFTNEHNIDNVNASYIWDVISDSKFNTITYQSIHESLVVLDLERRVFASMIFTNRVVVGWILFYSSIFLYGLGIIIIFNIWGYEQAFGTGVDLFKLYLLGITYIIGILKSQLQFIVMMISKRPFNIGDLILYKSDPCIVTSLNSSFAELDGVHKYFVKNVDLLDLGVENLSKSNICDSFTVSVPVNYYQSVQNITDVIEKYTGLANEIVSCRVTYGPSDRDCFILSIHWTYRYNMFDRNEYLWTRTRVINYIMHNMSDQLGELWMRYYAAEGGAYNHLIERNEKII